jgi:hypothetical protein
MRLHRDDVASLFDHLDDLVIAHGDEKFRNLLRAPPEAQVFCTKHGKKHGWLFVDWEAGVSAVRFTSIDTFLNIGRAQICHNEL